MIEWLANAGVLITAILHLWFFVLEFFLWTTPIGLKVFRMNQTIADQSATLAANQGLYNAFLSAGLIWGLFSTDPGQALHVKIFFLGCVTVAGVYAGITVNRRIFLIQALPAIISLLLLVGIPR